MSAAIDQVKNALNNIKNEDRPSPTTKPKSDYNKALATQEFSVVVNKFQGEIAKALPSHLKANAERYARQALTLFSENPKLQQCTGISLLSALMRVSELGLDLSQALGEVYIIPYNNRNQMVANVQLGYRGVLKLMHRSGKIKNISAHVVYENDEFSYQYGFQIDLKHIPAKGERGARTHVYAVAMYGDGGRDLEVWTWDEVMAHAQKFSKGFSYASSPWQTATNAMAEKTLILALWKRLPLEIEVSRALAVDNSSVSNADAINKITEPSDILDVAGDPIEITDEN